MPFPLKFIDDLGKVIAVRFTKNSGAITHGGDGSVSAGLLITLPSPVFPSDSSLVQSGPQISDIGAFGVVQLSLSVLQAVAGPIPLAGGLMQTAINGLLATLQAIDVRIYLEDHS
jgi:hypothetical protein